MVAMIIKGLFRRYERWNPVHPTSGAFYGMGFGIGCGVGWGPGFGPDVIGYVGAGCGLGFSVGITFAGFGIGLPANFLFQLPYKGIEAARSGELDLAVSNVIRIAGYRWNQIAPCVSGFQREAIERLSSFKQKHLLDDRVDLSDVNCMNPFKSVREGSGRFRLPFLPPRKDLKD